MTDGIGKALASAIKDEAEPASEKRGRHIFHNQHRRCIFSLLTMNPCLGLVDLASKCGIAPNTAEWHVGALIDSGYVVEHNFGRRRVFYPDGLITHEKAMLFRTINHPRSSILLRFVMKNPGRTQTEIASELGKSRQWVAKTLDELESAGLVSVVSEGNHMRHYPTRLLPDMAEEFYKYSKDYTEYTLGKLSREGGKNPVLIKKSLDRIIVEAGHASNRFNIEIGVNPYISCLGC